MDELLQLREYIEHGHYTDALVLIGEMEAMSRDDKAQKIESLLKILLGHLIEQRVKKRTMRSWDVSIRNALDAISRVNKRRRAGSFYLDRDELTESIDEILPSALRQASLEAFEGRRDDFELRAMLDIDGLKQGTLAMIATDASGQSSTGR